MVESIQYLTNGSDTECFLAQEASESLNCAVVDSGCGKNVCGQNWLKCFEDTLPPGVKLIESEPSKEGFRFGSPTSPLYMSSKRVTIPARLGKTNKDIVTDVVECDVPMLLSTPFMKLAKSSLDFVNDVITMFGETIHLQHTSSGHYCIPIIFEQPTSVLLTNEEIQSRNPRKKREIALKLHKQFGHPLDSDKLKNILKDANFTDQELFDMIDTVTNECDICDRYRKMRSRPVVSIPLANDFNEALALDLKFITINNKTFIILHMIDMFTRYSQATVIPSKAKEVIVNDILKNWVSIFGTPQGIMSDNGGEFDNGLLRDVAELLNTKVLTSAAYSPWSNGIVERHNAVIENMLLKIVEDGSCSVKNALVWAISAKNALHNNRGYSPNQLVFGRNPNLPSVLSDKPPALRTYTPSKLITEHLNALHLARKCFIESEASKRIKLALSRQTRDATSKEFCVGDSVYYKRPDGKSKDWHGPATVIGTDSKIVFIRHGGQVLRVSPIHLRAVVDSPKVPANKKKSKSQQLPERSLIVPTDTIGQSQRRTPEVVVSLDFDALIMHTTIADEIESQSASNSMTWYKITGTYGGHDPEKIITPLIFVHFSCAFDRRWLNSCTF